MITWCDRIFSGLTKLEESRPSLGAITETESFPPWLKCIVQELLQQSLPAVPVRCGGPMTPDKLGRFLGQYCANYFLLGEVLEALGKPMPGLDQWIDINRLNPSPDSKNPALMVSGIFEGIANLDESASKFERILIRAFKIALDQESHSEAASFFRGFSKGLSSKRSPVEATSATTFPIYFRMFLRWQEVEKLTSVSDLRSFLLAQGVKEEVLGDPKRLEKICQRIGLSFRKPGRPRTTEVLTNRPVE